MSNYTDKEIAQKYITKIGNANTKGHEFTLSFSQFKKIITRKYCGYTGELLTKQCTTTPSNTDITIDRIDNKQGYVPGNVIACTSDANAIKAVWENPINSLNAKLVLNIAKRHIELMSKLEK